MNIFIAVLIVFLSLVSLSCDSERYISAREKPLPPQLIELMPGTKNDTLPAIIVKFSHTDTLPASIMVESAESDTVFSLEVFDIPPTFGKYASPIIDQLSGNQTLSRFFFRAYAASRKGIISDPSDTLTIQLLDKAPVIDSVVIRENYPVVYYTVFAQLGLTQNIAIVMADSVLLEIAVPHSFNDVKQYTRQLTGAPVDSLRVWGNRAGRAGKPFGIRLIVEIPQQGEKAYGVAAASLHLPPL